MFFQCKWVFRLAIALLFVHFVVLWNYKSNPYKFIGYSLPQVSSRTNETQEVSYSKLIVVI